MAADPLDSEIAKAREEVAQADAEVARAQLNAEKKRARLEGLEQAARLRPATGGPSSNSAYRQIVRRYGSKGGRQPGSISKTWRRILVRVAAERPAGANEEQIVMIGRDSGLENLRQHDVHRRLTLFQLHGYVERAEKGLWIVQRQALAKFASEASDADTDELALNEETADRPEGTSAV